MARPFTWVPRPRLLYCVALVGLPVSVLAAVHEEAWLPSLTLGVSLVAGILLDAWWARRALVGLDVVLPPVIRAARDREARIEVRVRNAARQRRQVRLGLPLPPGLESAEEVRTVALPADAEWSSLAWLVVPRARGRFCLPMVCLEGWSPAGFWAVRRRLPLPCELRVYPNLGRERKKLASRFLRPGASGAHVLRQVGKGREFEKLREYVPGDSFDEIHWKATARRARPITKVHQVERTQEVYVVLDASRLSARRVGAGSREATAPEGDGRSEAVDGAEDGQPLFEMLLTAALTIGLAAERQGDRFGLLVFSNRVETFLRAGNGRAHFSACRDALHTRDARLVNPDFEEAIAFLRLRVRRRSLLLFLTSLDDPVIAEGFLANLELIRRQHLVLVHQVRPPGVEPLFTGPEVRRVDDLYERLGGHLRAQRLLELSKVLQRRGVGFAAIEHGRLCVEAVSRYLEVKRRQLL